MKLDTEMYFIPGKLELIHKLPATLYVGFKMNTLNRSIKIEGVFSLCVEIRIVILNLYVLFRKTATAINQWA